MSGKNDQPSTNLLFSPGNNDLFTVGNAGTFLVPVQSSTSSALMTSESIPAEEDNFLGQNNRQQPSTFSMFSGDSTNNDPFSSIGGAGARDPFSAPAGGGTKVNGVGVVTSQQEPHLFVPPSTAASPVPLSAPVADPNYSTPVPASHTFQPSPAPPMMGTPAASTSHMTPPPPSGAYMGTPPTHRSHYTSPRYVVPDYNNVSIPASSSQGHAHGHIPPPSSTNYPPPPTSGYPPQSYTPPVPHTLSSAGPPPSFTNLANSAPPPPTAESMYHHVPSHWCYSKLIEDKPTAWHPFSYYDSQRLEEASSNGTDGTIPTEGGRYDVHVNFRERTSVYWEEPSAAVRRCTWFAKSDNEHRYEPLEEELAEDLEKEYRQVVMSNNWHKQIDLEDGEMIIIHNPQVIVHLIPTTNQDSVMTPPEQPMRSRIIKRGIQETELRKEIPENEIGAPDHIVFVCHGIGPVCDLRSRSIVECVDEFRAIQLSLLKSHFKVALETKRAHRIEFLPIHWHRALHGDATGVDRDIRRLTLPSIQRLRNFTNETLLDILFYSSPVYCQTIAETIGSEINSLHQIFLNRNPNFKGRVSLAGHSLGSLMLFDLLCNQGTESSQVLDSSKLNPPPQELTLPPSVSPGRSATPSSTHEEIQPEEEVLITLDQLLEKLNLNNFKHKFEEEQMDMDTLLLCSEGDLKDIGLPMGPRKKLIGYLKQQQEEKERKREQQEAEAKRLREEKLLKEQEAAAAEAAAVAASHTQQRLESLTSFMSSAMNVHVDFQQYDSGTGQPMVKYPQLEFNPLICFALGSPIGMFLTVRGVSELGEDFALPTCNKFINIFHPYDPVAYRIEPLINPDITLKPVQVPHYKGRKRLHLELRDSLGRMGTELKQGIINSVKKAIGSMQRFAANHWQTGVVEDKDVEEEVKKVTDELMQQQSEKSHEGDDTVSVASESTQADVGLGKVNQGQRIDYVLQERPLESFNDYLFAFQSHFCYWNSEDTVLLMMKEIYKSMNVLSDSSIKKQQLSEQKPSHAPPPLHPYGAHPPMTSPST